VGVCRERRRLLVPRVVDGDALIDAAVVDRLNVPPAQRENYIDAVPFQGLGE
jgi:hypothetical protein